MFKIGNKIRFLNEVGFGTIKEVLNGNRYIVTRDDGFDLAYSEKELVLDKNHVSVFPGPEMKSVTKTAIPEVKNETAMFDFKNKIFVAVISENIQNPSAGPWQLIIANYSAVSFYFTFSFSFSDTEMITHSDGLLQSNSKLLLAAISSESMNEFLKFRIEGVLFSKQPHWSYPPISEWVKLNPSKLFKNTSYQYCTLFSEPSIFIEVEDFSKDKLDYNADLAFKSKVDELVEKRLNRKTKKASNKANNSTSTWEVDLHLEEIKEHTGGMTNTEKLNYQLNYFKVKLDEAINLRIRKVVFIHGVGNGTLKKAIRDVLGEYEKVKFEDASYAKYGFGATEVIIG